MTLPSNVQTGCAPPLACTRGAIRWICTNNPFYVLSAGLFLAGLWVSFGNQGETDNIQAEETLALMSWLAGYTLLLAGTAYLFALRQGLGRRTHRALARRVDVSGHVGHL
jgi:hypothetical protein